METNTQNTNSVADEVLKKELSAVFAHYGQPLRDMFLWFWWHEINTAKDADNKKVNQLDPGTLKNTLPEFGNMQILEVWSPKINPGNFNSARNLFLKDQDRELADQLSLNAGYDPAFPNYYWFVASVNEKLQESQFDAEQKLAENFIGKYWYKYYNTPIPGASNSKTQISADSPDGSPQWYISSKDITALPIFGFGHEQGSRVANLSDNFKTDTKNNENGYNQDAGGSSAEKLRAVTSFLLLQRDAKFYPSKDKIKDYDTLFQFYKDYTPRMVGNDGRPDDLSALYPDAANDGSIALFFAKEYNDFQLDLSVGPNILDPYTPTMKKQVNEDQFGNEITNNLGEYGLINNNCLIISLGSMPNGGQYKSDMVIYTPSQAMSNYAEISNQYSNTPLGDQGYSNITTSQPGYKVYVEASANFVKVLPKIQETFGINASNTNVAAHVDYHFKEIQEDNLRLLQNGGSCIPSAQSIQKYISDVAVNSAYSQTSPQRTVSFKLPGICPQIWNVAQGLNSMTISISENGSFTSYSFEDKVIVPPSDDYVQQYLVDKAINASAPTVGQNSFTTQQAQMVSAAIG